MITNRVAKVVAGDIHVTIHTFRTAMGDWNRANATIALTTLSQIGDFGFMLTAMCCSATSSCGAYAVIPASKNPTANSGASIERRVTLLSNMIASD